MRTVPEDIKLECLDMQRFLEELVANDPQVLYDRITRTNVYLARSGKLLSEVKRLQDEAMLDVFNSYSDYIKSLSATTAKQFISANLADINYYVNWLDRLNRSFVHSGDNIRTQMSFLKEELRLTKFGY
ncbi:MAG: hypothetical protein NC229_08705 [Bacteroides sp.]|nr:hypothetical protein [Bacteroides sp.]MCM1403806.1 hypothetical protein [Bacteroides sp.]MCM1443542.1 hypothetical protein [Muribaculum sp.]MCM1577123.1 hypothetical protein [Bacteroides sp.]